MLAKVYSCALVGLEGAVVEVEADLDPRALPSVTLVGLPDAAVKESTDAYTLRSTIPVSAIPAAA